MNNKDYSTEIAGIFVGKIEEEIVIEAKNGNVRAQEYVISKYEGFVKAKSCQHSSCSIGKHLPGCIGALTIKEVAGKGSDGTHHKAGLRTEGDTGEHNDGKCRFEMWYWNGYTAHDSQSAHHRNQHQFSCLMLSPFKGQEKGH